MLICSQRSSILGSFCGRFAFMGKAVLGKLMVDFRSIGTGNVLPTDRIFSLYREGGRSMSIRRALFEGMQKVLFPSPRKRVQFLSDRSLRASNRLEKSGQPLRPRG